MSTFKLNVNDKKKEVDVDPNTPILWVLRDHLNLLGTKFGCGIAQCSACTIHLDGVAMRSCILNIYPLLKGKKITTIEGLEEKKLHPLQEAWLDHDVPQFGARPLKRVIQKEIVNQLAKFVLSGSLIDGETTYVSTDSKGFAFSEEPTEDKGTAQKKKKSESKDKAIDSKDKKREQNIKDLKKATDELNKAVKDVNVQNGSTPKPKKDKE